MTPKAAVIALLVAAEETKLDVPIVSHYRGVWWSRNSHKWQAAIQYGGVKEMLGTFPTEEEAAHAYDSVARREHGRAAQLNFPRMGERQGQKLRTVSEEELRRRQELRMAKTASERGTEEQVRAIHSWRDWRRCCLIALPDPASHLLVHNSTPSAWLR